MGEPLVVEVRRQFPVVALRVRGALDFDTAAGIRNALRKHLADQPAALVLDLSLLVVRHTAALGVVRAALRQASEWPGVPVIVVATEERVREALRQTGLDRHAPIVTDPEEAFALATSNPAPLRQVLRHVPPDPHILPYLRRVVRDACESWGVRQVVDEVQLVASELFSNAIEHARTPFDVTVAFRDRYVHLVVRDANPQLPRRGAPEALTDARGRGLLLIEGLSASWGAVPTDDGKLVWAMLPVHVTH